MRVRRLVESEAAALAARHATPAQIAQLVAAFNRLTTQMRANRIRPAADREFHLCIAYASANAALAQVIERLWQEGERAPQPADGNAVRLARAPAGQHRRACGDLGCDSKARCPAARRAMRVHLANAERQRLVLLRELKPEP
jgi:DNA-binding FadR family transcriptional regulator